jgi:hypothetical protein
MATAAYLYYTLNIPSEGTFWVNPDRVFDWPQNQALIESAVAPTKWHLTFLGWDSAWYLTIMTDGYANSPQSAAFSPGLPAIAGAMNMFFGVPTVALAGVALIFGVLWIPLYQLFAEKYVGQRAALLSAILLALSPYLFVFTTVAYSEGLMLFFVLASWVLLQRGHTVEASLIAAAAPLMRIMGILIVIPLLYSALKTPAHRARNVLLSFLPVASLALWFLGFGLTTGDFLAPFHTTEWNQMYSLRAVLLEGIPQYGVRAVIDGIYLQPPVTTHWLLPFAVAVSFILPLVMLVLLWRKDKVLWLYGAVGYLGIVLFGALASSPRFFAVLFPLYIPLAALLSENKKSLVATVALSIVFLFAAVDLWQGFLCGEFVA